LWEELSLHSFTVSFLGPVQAFPFLAGAIRNHPARGGKALSRVLNRTHRRASTPALPAVPVDSTHASPRLSPGHTIFHLPKCLETMGPGTKSSVLRQKRPRGRAWCGPRFQLPLSPHGVYRARTSRPLVRAIRWAIGNNLKRADIPLDQCVGRSQSFVTLSRLRTQGMNSPMRRRACAGIDTRAGTYSAQCSFVCSAAEQRRCSFLFRSLSSLLWAVHC